MFSLETVKEMLWTLQAGPFAVTVSWGAEQGQSKGQDIPCSNNIFSSKLSTFEVHIISRVTKYLSFELFRKGDMPLSGDECVKTTTNWRLLQALVYQSLN